MIDGWGQLRRLSNSERPHAPAHTAAAGDAGQWAPLGKLDGRGGISLKRRYGAKRGRTDRTACLGFDSRKVAIEVGILQGVCYNSPAESKRPEN